MAEELPLHQRGRERVQERPGPIECELGPDEVIRVRAVEQCVRGEPYLREVARPWLLEVRLGRYGRAEATEKDAEAESYARGDASCAQERSHHPSF